MKTFKDFELKAPLLRAIEEMHFEKPSPIQAQTLPILLEGRTDLIGLAATGTGKTAAFSIPFLQTIDTSHKKPQVLVLCPTRELALQVSGQVQQLGKHLKIKSLPVYGGAGFGDQLHGLKEGAHVVVGTPGRLIDHLERGTLKLDAIQTLVLDEADEMISMGFKEDLEIILKSIPRSICQVWLFSATMSSEVRRVADTYLKYPKMVQINRTEMLSSTVEQLYYLTREGSKPDLLCKLIDAAENFYGLIFCQTKSLVVDLARFLSQRGYQVDCLQGDMDQNARERAMQAFRDRRVQILICTDVASRGLDVKDVTHVINYSIPRELDSYVHRIGRTARSGKSGVAMSLVTPSHMDLIHRIEKMTRSRMREGKPPSRKDIAEKKILKVLAEFKASRFHGRASELLGKEWLEEISSMTKEEIVGRFLEMRFKELFEVTEEPRPKASFVQNEKPDSRRTNWKDKGGKGHPRSSYGKPSSHRAHEKRSDGKKKEGHKSPYPSRKR